MGIIDLSGQTLLYGVVAMVWIVATHGLFVALFARVFGEPGPQYDGRLTLNPITHAELIGVLALILTPFGWISPMRLNPAVIKGGIAGILAVIVLSLAATIALAGLLWSMRPVIYSLLPGNAVGLTLIGLAETTAEKSVSFALFNLLPIPPLTAGLLWAGLAPKAFDLALRRTLWIAAALAAFILSGIPAAILSAPADWIQSWLFV